MKFTQFLPDSGAAEIAAQENKAAYADRHDSDYMEFVISLAASEANNRRTGGYLKFGPYWWALKAILSANGHYLGSHMDGLVAAAYSIKDENGNVDDLLTITAAFEFRDHYLGSYFVGTNQFELFDDDQYYILEDPDMIEA